MENTASWPHDDQYVKKCGDYVREISRFRKEKTSDLRDLLRGGHLVHWENMKLKKMMKI